MPLVKRERLNSLGEFACKQEPDSGTEEESKAVGVKREPGDCVKSWCVTSSDDSGAGTSIESCNYIQRATSTISARDIKLELGSQSVIECETYCALPLSASIANDILNSMTKEERIRRRTLVLYFNDDVRITNAQVQRKETLERRTFAYLSGSFDSPILIPMVRAVSIETKLDEAPSVDDLTTEVVRYILFYKESTKIRVSLELRQQISGKKYYLTGEVEYEQNVNFDEMKLLEAGLVSEIRSTLEGVFINRPEVISRIFSMADELPQMNESDLFKMPCRVFTKLHQTRIEDTRNVKIKYKFDGFKGKMVCVAPNKVLYQDDLNKIKPLDTSMFNSMKNIIFQIENMCTAYRKGVPSPDDEVYNKIPTIIITDILGIKMGGKVYMPEPLDVLKFLETFNRSEQYINFHDGGKQVTAQRRLRVMNGSKIPRSTFKTDGYILVYKNHEFKFKVPTFDIKIFNNRCYIKNENNVDVIEFPESYPYPNGIYEVTFKDKRRGTSSLCKNLEILRRRFDRPNPSTKTEIEEAIKEFDLLRRNKDIGSVLSIA